MLRAQGIKKRWEEIRKRDTRTTAPLMTVLELQYQKYRSICFWSCENPLSFGKWLCQPIEEVQ